MPATSNTSPIVALAKIGRLRMLRDLYGTVFVSPFVKLESVDRGKKLGASDALEIERAIGEDWIKVAKLTLKQSQNTRKLVAEARIGLGEAGALMIRKQEPLQRAGA
jgi:predicted nucleic acid-binding protein